MSPFPALRAARRGEVSLAASLGVVGLILAGCTTVALDAGSGDQDGAGSDGTDSGMVVLPGTGSYAIGADAPYGGFQLHGEPDEQPAGCTWQILDGDGGVSFENQGSYVFLTDVPEAVTFVTDGCPDWEQFE